MEVLGINSLQKKNAVLRDITRLTTILRTRFWHASQSSLTTETHNVEVTSLRERLSSLWHGGNERGAGRRLMAPYLHRDTVIVYTTLSHWWPLRCHTASPYKRTALREKNGWQCNLPNMNADNTCWLLLLHNSEHTSTYSGAPKSGALIWKTLICEGTHRLVAFKHPPTQRLFYSKYGR